MSVLLVAITLALAGCQASSGLLPPQENVRDTIRAVDLRADVTFLACPEFEGRRGGEPRGRLAARYLANQFARLKLIPRGEGNSYLQPIRDADDALLGYNVLGLLPGRDEDTDTEVILIAAHFDHLGQDENGIYAGAGDNASGVAVLLALARAFTCMRKGPRRSLLFAAFDLEEQGLLGSRYFAQHPAPLYLDMVKVLINFDMVGRHFLDLFPRHLFLIGYEHSPYLTNLARRLAPDYHELDVQFFGADLVGQRSDFVPFQEVGIPFLWFCTGAHPDYNTPNDTPDRIDYQKMESIGRFAFALVLRLATDEQLPAFASAPRYDPQEMEQLKAIVEGVKSHARTLGLDAEATMQLHLFEQSLAKLSAGGPLSPEARAQLAAMARALIKHFSRARRPQ